MVDDRKKIVTFPKFINTVGIKLEIYENKRTAKKEKKTQDNFYKPKESNMIYD